MFRVIFHLDMDAFYAAIEQRDQPAFHQVGPNRYRLESSGIYYALFKRGGRQSRIGAQPAHSTGAERLRAAAVSLLTSRAV
jgi:hypothetical protein